MSKLNIPNALLRLPVSNIAIQLLYADIGNGNSDNDEKYLLMYVEVEPTWLTAVYEFTVGNADSLPALLLNKIPEAFVGR